MMGGKHETHSALPGVLESLEGLAAYEGPWEPLRAETALLRERLRELRERQERLDDVLLVALVGGSGVGKSTLLNAIAGDELAPVSEMRPCTSIPTVYHPPGTELPFDGWDKKSGSALERLVIIDTPDSDTVMREHRNRVVEALGQADLVLLCGSPEKYLDEATWALLRPLQGQRTLACVETKATAHSASIREHWLSRLDEQGFDVTHYFRVNALHAFDRKLRGGPPGDDEFEFSKLESFLADELTQGQIQRIKRSNAAGLLRKTLETLEQRIASREGALEELQKRADTCAEAIAEGACAHLADRLFSEPHLWTNALGHECAIRAKGFVGTLYRAMEGLRSLPARLSAWVPKVGHFSAGRYAASLLTGRRDESDKTRRAALASPELDTLYRTQHSGLALAMAHAGFDHPEAQTGLAAFQENVAARLESVLEGPARERITTQARRLTSWPATLLLDLPPLAFVIFTGYHVVTSYFSTQLLTGTFFLHAAAVLALILFAELILIGVTIRTFAWTTRRRALAALRRAFGQDEGLFAEEREVVAEALRYVQTVCDMTKALAK